MPTKLRARITFTLMLMATVGLGNMTLLSIGMWFQNVLWRNWYLLAIISADAAWAFVLLMLDDLVEIERLRKKQKDVVA